jgi:aquaporin Z
MLRSLKNHWPEYAIEACGLAMLSCVIGSLAVLLFHPESAIVAVIPDAILRHGLMGIAVGGTSIMLVYSSWGQRSGAHFNPAVTLTYLCLGKVGNSDAGWYLAAHIVGALGGVGLMALVWRMDFGHPVIHYTASVPGSWGPAVTWCVEFAFSGILMMVILSATNSPRLARFAGVFVTTLTIVNVAAIVPLVGTSLNPARWLASAIPAHAWGYVWLYLTASPLGMLLAAYAYVRYYGANAIFCAKLHHDNPQRCIFCEAQEERTNRVSAVNCNSTVEVASNRQIVSGIVIGLNHKPEPSACPHSATTT